MGENDRDGVVSKDLSITAKAITKKDRQNKDADVLRERREAVLSQTSLTGYQVACLRDISLNVIRSAWFTVSHLLLEPGSMVAVMGCKDGTLAYAMAVMNPELHIIGLDSDRAAIMKAKKNWQLTNLEFIVSKVSKPSFPNNSLDAVVDAFTLHEIYSRQGYSESRVQEMLESHFALLKQNGFLFLRDYMHPPPGEYVLMEFPDVESDGDSPEDLSEADLLVLFSEEARVGDGISRGFFMEELEPYSPGTRLFRLPYKWAYEFILRKDNREEWAEELTKEYTFMTARELRKTLRTLGSRVIYTAPHWDFATIQKHYEGHFRLYDDDGLNLGFPATSHVFVARKVGEGESLTLQERRPSREPMRHLRIEAVRNIATGGIMDLVRRDTEVVEFLPYRVNDNGRVCIFLHDGLPRAVTNAVPRSGRNLDGKRWSGHMIEAVAIDREILSEYSDYWSAEDTREFSLAHLGLKPAPNAIMEQGPEFYPDPSMIDERIETKFLNVQKAQRSLTPRWVSQITKTYTDRGKIREFDAQQVLNAISIGVIPNTRLERQILALFSLLGVAADNWADTPLHLDEVDIQGASFQDLIKALKGDKQRFEKSEKLAGTIRSLHSYFIDEGVENGVVRGLAARDIEFIIKENRTVNTAVVLPLVKNMNGEVLAGYIEDYLPVPERMGRTNKTLRAPSFNLPPEVKDMTSARAYIAQQFDVNPDRVVPLGESYFIHNSITPQRIFPFAVTSNIQGSSGPWGTFTNYAPVRWLWMLVWHLYEDSFALTIKKAMERMHVNIDYGIDKNIGWDMGQESALWSVPPPIGMPIPSSPEEFHIISAEFHGDSSLPMIGDHRSVGGSSSSAGSGEEGSSSSSSSGGSGGGGPESKQQDQENKNSGGKKKIDQRLRTKNSMFENIDYSDIDGDRPDSSPQGKAEKEKKKSAQVISLLRPPPSRTSQGQKPRIDPVIVPVAPVIDVVEEVAPSQEADVPHEENTNDKKGKKDKTPAAQTTQEYYIPEPPPGPSFDR
ncbi:MAG: methyltransferase domain-containing protein [Rhodospirillales bacterium]|nr:methyltransferase domain-containing protein [Rhodospirillales bacterium]